MDHAERKRDIRERLRRAWNTALLALEAISISPMEDMDDRIERLERDVAMMKQELRSQESEKGSRHLMVTVPN